MVNSFFPSDGSIFGGTQVLVTGKGFTEHSIVQVFADNRPCIAIKARFPKKIFPKLKWAAQNNCVEVIKGHPRP